LHHVLIKLYSERWRAYVLGARRCLLLGLDDGRLPDRERAHCNHLQFLRRPLCGGVYCWCGEITPKYRSVAAYYAAVPMSAMGQKRTFSERAGCPLCARSGHCQRLYARSNNCFAISATLGSRGRGFKDSPFPRISIIIVNTATRPYGLSFAGTKYQGARFSEVFSNISSIATS